MALGVEVDVALPLATSRAELEYYLCLCFPTTVTHHEHVRLPQQLLVQVIVHQFFAASTTQILLVKIFSIRSNVRASSSSEKILVFTPAK